MHDLGIQMDSKLKFHTPTDIVANTAYHVLGLICKSDILLILYKS